MEVIMKRVEDLRTHEKNVEYFPEKPRNFDWLKEDIQENGIQQPIMLANDEVTILAGHLRVMIAEELEMEEVPAIVKEDIEPNSTRAEELLILDNFARRQIETDMHRARLIRKLKELKGVRQGSRTNTIAEENGNNRITSDKMSEVNNHSVNPSQEIAEQLGISDRQVQRLDKLNDLIPELQQAVEEKKISSSAAMHLAYLTPEEQEEVAASKKIEASGMNTKEAKKLRKEIEIYRQNAEEAEEMMNKVKKEKEEAELRIEKLQKTVEGLREDNRKGHEQLNKILQDYNNLEDKYAKIQEEKTDMENQIGNIPEDLAREDPQLAEKMDKLSKIKTELSRYEDALGKKKKEYNELEEEIREKDWERRDLEFWIAKVKEKTTPVDNAQKTLNKHLNPITQARSDIYYYLNDVQEDPYNSLLRTIDFYLPILHDITNTLQQERERIENANRNKAAQEADTDKKEQQQTEDKQGKVVNLQQREG